LTSKLGSILHPLTAVVRKISHVAGQQLLAGVSWLACDQGETHRLAQAAQFCKVLRCHGSDPTPSPEDHELTQRLAAAGVVMGIDLEVEFLRPSAGFHQHGGGLLRARQEISGPSWVSRRPSGKA
jgi:hypothetical protein